MTFTNFFKANKTKAIVAGFAILVSNCASATPLLVTEKNADGNDILMGAKNVSVNGSLYNVSFVKGSCNTVFSNCDKGKFEFLTSADAIAATNAILDQVFVGVYDTNPLLVNGCVTMTEFCAAATPYAISSTYVGIIAARNYDGSKADVVSPLGSIAFAEEKAFRSWAVWSKAAEVPNSVPEPTSLALFAVAAAGLTFARARQKSK